MIEKDFEESKPMKKASNKKKLVKRPNSSVQIFRTDAERKKEGGEWEILD